MPADFSTPPNELAFVGENKDHPEQLLCLGPDGKYYAYALPEGDLQPVEPDDQWKVETDASQELFT